MGKTKKAISVLAASLAASTLALAVCVSAVEVKDTVRYDQEGSLKYNTNGRYAFVYYDYGTSALFDNVNIQAEASSNQDAYIYAEIDYADYGASKWHNVYDDRTTKGSVDLRYNPAGVDYLEPGSYARAAWGSVIDYTLTVKR